MSMCCPTCLGIGQPVQLVLLAVQLCMALGVVETRSWALSAHDGDDNGNGHSDGDCGYGSKEE